MFLHRTPTRPADAGRPPHRGEFGHARRETRSFRKSPRSFHPAALQPSPRPRGRIHRTLRLILQAVALTAPAPAFAACPIELAVYGEAGSGAEVAFTPAREAATVTNSFRMLLDNDVALDGIVQWTEHPPRPNGMLMHDCPEGDVTGEELAACTLWQGVIYTSDEKGNIALLPAEGTAAPARLIFPDLGPSLRYSAANGGAGFSKLPWDVFALQGCQE